VLAAAGLAAVRRAAVPGLLGRGATPPPRPRPHRRAEDRRARAAVHARRQVRPQIGKPASPMATPQDGAQSPGRVEVDGAANELYVADGHGNRRVVVFDAATGAYKRTGRVWRSARHTNPGPTTPTRRRPSSSAP
jgi:hypothetical protein